MRADSALIRRGRAAAIAGAALLGALVVSETALRLEFRMTHSPVELARQQYLDTFKERVFEHWARPAGPDPFVAPYRVFANKGWEDTARLARIYEATRLPPSREWKTYDYLLGDGMSETTSYHVHSNSLGFRGPERKREKTKRVLRIIGLGSYQAFGLGVEDNETYLAFLERALNEAAQGDGKRVEVWNGGSPAATAIVGLARMSQEFSDYHPDLVILDYGTIDMHVVDDDLAPWHMRFPDGAGYDLLRSLVRLSAPVLARSMIFGHEIWGFRLPGGPERIREFLATMDAAISLAHRQGIPVLLIRQDSSSVPDEVYRKLLGPGVTYVSVKDVFRAFPPSAEQLRLLDPRRTWMIEVPPIYEFIPQHLDLFQLSVLGNAILGRALASEVRRALNR